MAPLFKFLEAAFDLFVPLVVASVIDNGIPAGDKDYIIRMCLVLVGLAVIGLVCSVTAQFFAAKAATGFAAGLRCALFAKLDSLSYSQIDKLGTPTMITRLTGDVIQIQNGINLLLRLLLRSPFIVAGAVITAFILDAKTALILCVTVPLLALAVWLVVTLSVPAYRRVQEDSDTVLGKVREGITGTRVIRAFNSEQNEMSEFTASNDKLTSAQNKAGGISALLNPVTYAIINIGVVALLYTGAVRVSSGALSQGTVIALYNYMTQILTELVKFANVTISLTKAAACGRRITAVLDMPEDKPMPTGKKGKPGYAVAFDKVSLAYTESGEESLSDISFTVRKGMTVGVIGGTGSGKTSLVNMIPGFYRASSGTVYVNGTDVNDYGERGLIPLTAVVPQKASLFKGTVRENLLWGNPDATDGDIMTAVKAAQAADVILSKNEGLDAVVEQNGRNFSGGQRQRLTIARALVKKPEILILDDSSSALDFATDAALRKAVSELDGTTVFIAAQRASSVINADLILVLDDGRLIAKGTNKELLEKCEVYREIYYSQYPQEEQR